MDNFPYNSSQLPLLEWISEGKALLLSQRVRLFSNSTLPLDAPAGHAVANS